MPLAMKAYLGAAKEQEEAALPQAAHGAGADGKARSAPAPYTARFPQTRYQGAKRRILPALRAIFSRLPFDTALDAFGGTGAVSYLLKELGKEVAYNDLLRWNCDIGRALIANDDQTLSTDVAGRLCEPVPGRKYKTFVSDTFQGIYFTPEEDAQIDIAIQNAQHIPGAPGYIARFALYQACLIKRPYNLFHRANLSLRLADVPRSFGNKASWDRPFTHYLTRFTREANAAVFRGKKPCRVFCGDATTLEGDFDLVYADPPYVSARGVGVDYLAFYHFLEGLAEYDAWPQRVDLSSRHRAMHAARNPWSDPKKIEASFDKFFARWQRSILVVSYRANGIPSPEELKRLLLRYKKNVEVHTAGSISYALSKVDSKELVFVAT